MPQPVPVPDEIDQANGAFWRDAHGPRLDLAVAPLRADESFAIDDLTEAEWVEFVRAMHE